MLGKYWLIAESCLFSGGAASFGAAEFIRELKRQNLPFVFLTNHSSHLRSEMADAYEAAGLQGIQTSMFYTSTMAGVDAILKAYPDKRTAGYIGGRGMQKILQEGGFAVDLDHADWLFIGTDRHASFEDYSYGLRLMETGAQIVSTDPRRMEYTKNGPAIGSGSIVRMMEYAGAREALECGMPSPILAVQAMNYLSADIHETVLVGSHLNSEIQCGIDAGIKTVLVTSGMDEHEDGLLDTVKPDYVVETMAGLLR